MGSVHIPRSEFARIPYIDVEAIGGRVLTTLAFHSGSEWEIWHPSPRGLLKLKGEPVEADYFAKEPQKSTDAYFDFLEFMTQRASWPDVIGSVDGVRRDLHNLGASLGKLALFHRHREVGTGPSGTKRYVTTELEYIFTVCRSIFDLLQKVIRGIWNNDRVKWLDGSKLSRKLPTSFADVVLKKGELIDETDIADRYDLDRRLAHFYHRQGQFFDMLRTYRNRIIHKRVGVGFDWVFVTDKGFAVSDNTKPFCDFGVWNEAHKLPNRLASLRPAVAHVVLKTLAACEDFADVINRVIKFPKEIVPDFHLYMRGPHIGQLRRLETVIHECAWWDDQSGDTLEASPDSP